MKKYFILFILFQILFLSSNLWAGNILLLHADASRAEAVRTALASTNLLGTIDIIDMGIQTPTLSTLLSYSAIFAWTNTSPQNGVLLGDTLANYVDAGGGLLINTYAISSSWSITGRLQTTGYAPLIIGSTGTVSNVLNIVTPDPIFNGVNISNAITFSNSNYALPSLAPGATLLATSNTGTNMIARNATGNIISMNIFPGNNTNSDTSRLFANALLSVQGHLAIPEPGTILLLSIALLGLNFYKYSKKR